MKRSFTLIELIVVVIIIGILAAFAAPQFAAVKQKALDKEAIANLQIIRAAQRAYKIDMGSYYSGDVLGINTNLKLDLPTTWNGFWTYTTDGETATATHVYPDVSFRGCSVAFGNDDVPVCAGGEHM